MKILFDWKRLCGIGIMIVIVLLVLRTVWQGQFSSHSNQIQTQASRSSTKDIDNLPEASLQNSQGQYGRSSNFETGVVFPRWGTNAYSMQDANWLIGLREIADQTSAKWITLTINFHQASEFATQVTENADTSAPAAIGAGIRIAKSRGYHVFILPLISLDSVHAWSGYIHFSSIGQAQAWFDSYWQAIQPYVKAAQDAGGEQFAIGNEYEELQYAPAFLWQQLLQRVRQAFSGSLVYCINWTSLQKPIPTWMHDSNLAAIGVSAYIPLTSKPQWIDPHQLPALWHEKASSLLDNFAVQLGKPLFISEIGYRDSAYAGYDPWQIRMNEPRDDVEQAALYDAALQNIANDKYISGFFVWAWSFPPFAPNGKLAAKVLHDWYIALKI